LGDQRHRRDDQEEHPTLPKGVEIEIYADVVCPWCYIGKRRLEQALASYDGEVTLRWRAFQLDPGAPHEGMPLVRWLGARYGGEDRARQMFARAAAVGASVGLRLDFERAIAGNTLDAHRVIWFAGTPGAVPFGAGPDTQAHVVEALHRSHFTDGLDLTDHEVLTAVADEVGLDPDRVRRMLGSDEGVAEVRAEMATARQLGVTGVPTFVFAGRYAVSGAQEPETLRQVLAELAGEVEYDRAG